MAHSFDATLKDLLAPTPEDFGALFDLPSARPVVSLNVDLSTISAATDVAFGFGAPMQEIVDLNFQSGPDPEVGARYLLYSAALRMRFGVPVRTILILLRPKADSREIQGVLTYASGQTRVEFHYEVIRMWEQPVKSFLSGGLQWLPLAMLCQMPPDRALADAMREVVHEIDRRLALECEHARAVRLMTAAFVLSGLRVERDALGPIFEGVRVMHQESTAFDYYVEEGMAKGMAKGLAKGMTKGMTEGAIQTAHRYLLRQGQKRLGPPEPATVAALNEIQEIDRLDRLADAMLSASSWQELLATP
jgi:hypothetical protein